MNDLIHRGELVTVSFNQGAELILTTLLSVDRDDDTLVFDWGGSEETNRKLLKSGRNIFVAKPDGIKVQFVTEPRARKPPSATARPSSPICRGASSGCSGANPSACWHPSARRWPAASLAEEQAAPLLIPGP
ncbi:MAG: flagellar brake protein [Comamonadaceae bacterium]|nr:flagellar brake protein [Comamonadaceae bacterium]